MIEAHGLTKSRGRPSARIHVLDGIDLHADHSTVLAPLGPNGAGRTRVGRVLATLTTAGFGTARVAGYDVVADRSRVRRAISLTGRFAAIDETRTGEENLRMTARLTGLSRAAARHRTEELLTRFDLTDAARRPPPRPHVLRGRAPPARPGGRPRPAQPPAAPARGPRTRRRLFRVRTR